MNWLISFLILGRMNKLYRTFYNGILLIMKAFSTLIIAILFSQFAIGQVDSISIKGKIIDKANKQPLMFANVVIYETGSKMSLIGTETDLDGNYTIPNLESGLYNINISYVGYLEKNVTNIKVSNDTTVVQNVELSEEELNWNDWFNCREPMIRHDNFTRGRVFTAEDLEKSPIKN